MKNFFFLTLLALTPTTVFSIQISLILPENGLIFDIGANVGEKTELYLKKNNAVICVEPQPSCIAALKSKFAYNKKVTIEEVGLDKQPGTSELFICSQASTISTCSKKWVEESRFSNGSYSWNTVVPITVNTLDLLVDKYGIPDFCKIDVEGFEYQVIQGLSKKIPLLSFEFAVETLDETKKCILYLTKLGYEKFNFALGENENLASKNWFSSQELLEKIDLIANKDYLAWGDIYATQ